MNLDKNLWIGEPGFQPLSEAFLYASPERIDAMSFRAGTVGLKRPEQSAESGSEGHHHGD